MSLLDVSSVTQRFGGLEALSNINLHIETGELLAVIGPNGAGKTTLFNLLTGVYRPSEGVIRFDGKDLTGLASHQIVRRGIARTFQNIRLVKTLTVLEHVMVARQCQVPESLWETLILPRAARWRRAELVESCRELLHFVGIGSHEADLATSLPYGDQRRLEIARALATDPKLVLLDEPAAGMNPIEKERLMQLIHRIRRDLKKTVMLIEHDMKVVMNTAERIVVLNFGKQIADGTPDQVRANPQVIQAYLGTGSTRTKKRVVGHVGD